MEAATGKELWNKPKVGKYHAALLRLGDGNLLMHDDTTGDLRLLAANLKEYQELARSKACGPDLGPPGRRRRGGLRPRQQGAGRPVPGGPVANT